MATARRKQLFFFFFSISLSWSHLSCFNRVCYSCALFVQKFTILNQHLCHHKPPDRFDFPLQRLSQSDFSFKKPKMDLLSFCDKKNQLAPIFRTLHTSFANVPLVIAHINPTEMSPDNKAASHVD